MLTIKLSKHDYSEWVLRHALYWMPDAILVSSDPLIWVVEFNGPAEDAQLRFHQLLNDYRLREIIDLKTGGSHAIASVVVSQIRKDSE